MIDYIDAVSAILRFAPGGRMSMSLDDRKFFTEVTVECRNRDNCHKCFDLYDDK